jgi:hypothetical protein
MDYGPFPKRSRVKTYRSTQRRIRGNPLLRERMHDPYRAREKLHDATGCPQCGARFRNGRWSWPAAKTGEFRQQLCPACRRVNDHYPAGELLLSGSFLGSHRAEVLATAQHVAELEKSLRPLHRIMAIEDKGEVVRILTTDLHLPHRIAHALRDAWGGEFSTHYDRDGYFARVQWRREN